MTSPSPSSRALSTRRSRLLAVGVLTSLLLGTLAAFTPISAQAAGGVSSIISTATVIGDNRVVSVTIGCSGSTACSGTFRFTSAAITTPAAGYSVAKNSRKAYSQTLSAAQFARLGGSTVSAKATLSQKKPRVKTISRSVNLVKATAKISLTGTVLTVDDAGKPGIGLKCSGAATCRGSAAATIAGIAGTPASYTIAGGKSATLSLSITPAQRAKLGATATAHKLIISETAPGKLSSTRAITARRAPSALGQKTTSAIIDASGTLGLSVSCAVGSACVGTLRPSIAGVSGPAVSYSLASGATGTVALALSGTQIAALGSGSATATIAVAESKPRSLAGSWRVSLTRATPAITVSGVAAHANAQGAAVTTVRCAAGAACVGTLTPRLGGITGAATAFTVPAGTSAEIAVALTSAQRATLGTSPRELSLEISERAPRAVTSSATAQIAALEYSVAYAERNWVPTSYDSCPAALHASFTATGPDGKLYPTWHPAQVTDPATGTLCSFGHEHGDDPATSNINDWVENYLAPVGDHTNLGLPFGYGSEELNTYSHHHEGMAMRHEDNAGHKVFVANDVKLLDSDRDWVMQTSSAGVTSVVTCDYLIKQHQGSWSADASSNNAHELIYASKCSDGTEIITTMLSRFGNANEFFANCAPTQVIPTVGSNLPAGEGGTRQLPTSSCVEKTSAKGAMGTWDIYELWKGENVLRTTSGTELAHFDPWFGIRNPSRYVDEASSTAQTNAISRPLDLAWRAEKPIRNDLWASVGSETRYDWRDPRSPFDGSIRDFYLNQNSVSAAVSAPTIYTDPYGGSAATVSFPGAIKQHLVAGTRTTLTTLDSQRSPIRDHGSGRGVHAPN